MLLDQDRTALHKDPRRQMDDRINYDHCNLPTGPQMLQQMGALQMLHWVIQQNGRKDVVATMPRQNDQPGNAVWAEVDTPTGPVKIISLHAPNTKEERTILWTRIEDLIGGGTWILAGDFNMVETQDDSRGKSAMAAGAEARSWNQLAQRKGLVDAYLCAVSKIGGLYTRQAFCGNRLDRARLDRFYLSENAEWLEVVLEVSHKSEQILSDHIPIVMQCNLPMRGNSDWRPKSYYKMGPAVLKRKGITEKMKLAWENHPPDTGNPQRRWEMAWIRIREVLKTESRQMKEEHREIHDLRLEVLSLRLIRQEETDTNHNLMEQLRQAEEKLRRREQDEARSWRLRSRVRWLREGEAPTRYFYAQTKAKFCREAIQVLEDDQGPATTDHNLIMNKVEEYYRSLYQREEITPEIRLAREEAFRQLTKKVTQDQDRSIGEWPKEEEIDATAKLLKNDKSPGLDGLNGGFD
ncbi:hypothetical protein R1sor_008435 [Riccia sorocarpa]|uniref:Endonuclease/exonuclease/phosphatase domain-containing protein n=1 Tax=Riccia sorocarpa TaxID=122646 RepID=A0ABD3HWU5_9MARC